MIRKRVMATQASLWPKPRRGGGREGEGDREGRVEDLVAQLCWLRIFFMCDANCLSSNTVWVEIVVSPDIYRSKTNL